MKLVKTDQITNEMIVELAETMQPLDKESIKMLTGWTPYEALYHSVVHSEESQAWYLDGELVAMTGVGRPSLMADACPWLLCTESSHKSPRVFMMATKEWMLDVTKRYGRLSNVVYSGHKRSVRWLGWLGCKLGPAQPLGPYGALFHRHTFEV